MATIAIWSKGKIILQIFTLKELESYVGETSITAKVSVLNGLTITLSDSSILTAGEYNLLFETPTLRSLHDVEVMFTRFASCLRSPKLMMNKGLYNNIRSVK